MTLVRRCSLLRAPLRDISEHTRSMSPQTDSVQKKERPWPTVSRSTQPSRRYADSSEGIVRCVLYCADVKLRACSGRERPEQPKSKLFAKLAVELFVLILSARLSAFAATW